MSEIERLLLAITRLNVTRPISVSAYQSIVIQTVLGPQPDACCCGQPLHWSAGELASHSLYTY